MGNGECNGHVVQLLVVFEADVLGHLVSNLLEPLEARLAVTRAIYRISARTYVSNRTK